MTAHQPFVHDLALALAAPVQAWSARDGQLDGSGAQGIYYGDRRIVRAAQLSVDGPDGPIELAHGSTHLGSDGGVAFHAIARLHEGTADPLGAVTRVRHADPAGLRERITVATSLDHPLPVLVRLRLTPDATPLNLIKAGLDTSEPLDRSGARWSWRSGATARLSAEGAQIAEADVLEVTWRFTVPAYGAGSVEWRLDAEDDELPFLGSAAPPLSVPALRGPSASLSRLVARSVADLSALRMCERDDPQRTFFGAGAPWYLTLFGRDSLIAARLFRPVDGGMALGTLRTLAARQGRLSDVDRAEHPGKILHEVRGAALDLLEGTVLPPEYYGTIDATALWILLLGELVDDGLDPVAEGLFEPLLAALVWLKDFADPDGDGFLEYYDESGHGLANQGWKDSGDSVRWADGRIADGPIALAEVQGYAHQAAVVAAGLLRRCGRTEQERGQATHWLDWAARLRARFAQQFWATDELGRYPVIALDRDKRPVTGVASNMGHLIGTGLLDAAEEHLVVDRLLDPTVFSGYGIRTMATTNAAYWPTRYHVGSVWTHDTAMIIDGMLRSGFTEPARRLAEGLLRAAEGFDYRLPELFGGQGADEVFPPVPYPASCRPQAWAAASGITVARALGAL